MRIFWQLNLMINLRQSQQHINLTRRIIHMVITANHLRNAHVAIIHHHTKVISGRAVCTGNNQIIQLAIGNFNATFNQVIPSHHPFFWVFKADNGFNPNRNCWQCFTCLWAPFTIVARFFFIGHLLLTQGLKFFAA